MSQNDSGGAQNPDDPDLVGTVPPEVLGEPMGPDDAMRTAAAALAAADEPDEPEEPVIRRRRPMTPGEKSADSMLMSSAASRRIAREKEADDALAGAVQRFMASESMGYFQVERLGPPALPEPERGVVGEIRFIEITGENASIAGIVRERWGGGTYMLIAKRSDNSDGEVNPVRIRVSGDPIPVSDIGKAWLAQARSRGRLDDDYARPAQDASGLGTQMFAVMMKMMESQAERDRLEREREREERRREDERREKQREREREEAAERERERREEEKERREREREEEKARRAEEARMLESRIQAQMQLVEADAAARIRAIEQQAEINMKRAEAQLKMDMLRQESAATSGLGIEGLSKLRTTLAEAMGKKLTDDLGLNVEEEDNSFGGILKDGMKEALPDFLRVAGATLLPKLAGLLPDRPGAAPGVPGEPQALPAPAPAVRGALPGPDGLEPVEEPSGDEPSVPQAPAATRAAIVPPPPSGEARRQQARLIAIRSVLAFTRPLSVLLLSRPDPTAAWEQDVGGDRTLADTYAAMTEQARVALVGDWPAFVDLVRKFAPEDADALAEGVAIEGGEAWISAFRASGPWNAPADEGAEEAAS